MPKLNSIKSYRVYDLLLLQTDTSVKTVFSDSECLKTLRFDKNSECDFSHKTNTFSYDENVKTLLKVLFFVSLKFFS